MAELISAMGNKSADDLPMTRPTPSTTVALRRSLATIGLVLLAACAGRTAETQAVIEHPAAVDIKQLWIDPVDLESRDLFNGPGGAKLAPNPAARYEIVEVDETGFSAGYAVRDDQGTAWNVKLGIEAQPEVVASRLLWALGYHQPPTYLVTTWKLAGEESGAQGISRFRRESPNEKVVSDWSWYENPFERTQPFKGLVVANLILNNWDWKTSNNKVYAGDAGHRKYIVRDVGASLGKTTFPQFLKWTPLRMGKQGSRNDLEGFEGQGFIKGVGRSRQVRLQRRQHASGRDRDRAGRRLDVPFDVAPLATTVGRRIQGGRVSASRAAAIHRQTEVQDRSGTRAGVLLTAESRVPQRHPSSGATYLRMLSMTCAL